MRKPFGRILICLQLLLACCHVGHVVASPLDVVRDSTSSGNYLGMPGAQNELSSKFSGIRTYTAIAPGSDSMASVFFEASSGRLIACAAADVTCAMARIDGAYDAIPGFTSQGVFHLPLVDGGVETCTLATTSSWRCIRTEIDAKAQLGLAGSAKSSIAVPGGMGLTCEQSGDKVKCTSIRPGQRGLSSPLVGQLTKSGPVEVLRSRGNRVENCALSSQGSLQNCIPVKGLDEVLSAESVALSPSVFGGGKPVIVAISGNTLSACAKSSTQSQSEVVFSCQSESSGADTSGILINMLSSVSGRTEGIFLQDISSSVRTKTFVEARSDRLFLINQSLQNLVKEVTSSRVSLSKYSLEEESDLGSDPIKYPVYFEACIDSSCTGFWGDNLYNFWALDSRQCNQCDVDALDDLAMCERWNGLSILAGGAGGLIGGVVTSIVTGGIGAGAAVGIYVGGLSIGAALGAVVSGECRARAMERQARCKQRYC